MARNINPSKYKVTGINGPIRTTAESNKNINKDFSKTSVMKDFGMTGNKPKPKSSPSKGNEAIMAMAKKKVAPKEAMKKETYKSLAAKRKHEKAESPKMKRMEKRKGMPS